jgi:hypothetical protein
MSLSLMYKREIEQKLLYKKDNNKMLFVNI